MQRAPSTGERGGATTPSGPSPAEASSVAAVAMSREELAEKAAGKGRAAADGSDDAGAVADAAAARKAREDMLTSPPAMFFEDLTEFVHAPAPEGLNMQCEMVRMKKGSFGRHPVYHFKLQRKKNGKDQKCVLLAARRRKKAMSNNFVISTDPTDLEPHGDAAVGKLRSNKKANEFTLFDTGYNRNKSTKKISKAMEKRKALRRASCGDELGASSDEEAGGGGSGGGAAAAAGGGSGSSEGEGEEGAASPGAPVSAPSGSASKKDLKAKEKELKAKAKAKAKARKEKATQQFKDGSAIDDVPGEAFEARKELAFMEFTNVKHQKSGPKVRQLTGAIPGLSDAGQPLDIRPANESETICTRLKSGTDDPEKHAQHARKNGIMLLNNKAPEWNTNLNAYALNFNGRVLKASVKNIQLVNANNPEEILLQFGRVSDDVFHVDYRFPLNAIQAFGICLTTFAAHQGPL